MTCRGGHCRSTFFQAPTGFVSRHGALAARLFSRPERASCHVALGRPPTGSSELLLSSIRQRLLAFAPLIIVSRHGAQLAFVGIFCGFARARLERNQDLRNQQVAIRDTMLGAEPRNLLICPHVVSDQDRKNSLLRRLPLSL